MRTYLLLMEEIRHRFNVINRAYHNENQFPPAMVREICYLEFRMICEIIAVSCLVAHGDIPEAKALRGTYEPGKIIKELGKLNPHFYPQPMEHRLDNNQHHLTGIPNTPHLSKIELPKLWGKAGDVIHRSPMVKVLSTPTFPTTDFTDVFEWSQELTGLLNSHWITLIENNRGILVNLQIADTQLPAATVFTFSPAAGQVSVEAFNLVK